MAEPSKSLSKEQIFKQVKQLCMRAEFVPSRHLICQAAGLNLSDPMKISRAEIRSQTSNPVIHKMLDIEQAFSTLKKTFQEPEPSPGQAEIAAESLSQILPLLSNKEQLFTRYWINNCQAYIPDIAPEKRLTTIQEIIRLTPKGENDSLLFNCSSILSDLDIGSRERYHTLKKAYQKTNKTGNYAPHYKDLLSKSGYRYYRELTNQARQESIPYEQRCAAVYEAVNVINDLDYSVSRKCNFKIELLSNLEKIQRQSNDTAGLKKTSELKHKYTNQAFNISRIFTNPQYAERYR